MQFGTGLNVITGETGSGKSIILNALELILGGRSNTNFIRSGCSSLEIQAHFDLSSLDAQTRDSLPDIAKHDELVIQRSLLSSGKGKVYINGNLGTVSLLHEIGARLITICSQSQQIRLLDAAYHLDLLDLFIADDKLLRQYQDLYLQWTQKKRELQEYEKRFSERETRILWLEETIAELEPLSLTPTTRVDIEATVKRLSSLQKIQNLSSEIEQYLHMDDGAASKLSAALSAIIEIEKIDSTVAPFRELLQSAKNELLEAERELKRYLSALESDDDTFSEYSEKLTLIARLERKHKTDVAGLCSLLQSSKEELSILGKENGINSLREELSLLDAALEESAERLHSLRRKNAQKLEQLIIEELSELNMGDVRFEVSFVKIEPAQRGCDKVEFLIAPNKGEQVKPLRQIASGGELSRITLVLKKLLRDASGINVLVFDEVDSGISGAVARAVGEKLKALSETSQVICITHLPQVASLASTHLLVSKSSKDRTITCVRTLTNAERVDEIARMLSGFEITKAAKDTAKSLMKVTR